MPAPLLTTFINNLRSKLTQITNFNGKIPHTQGKRFNPGNAHRCAECSSTACGVHRTFCTEGHPTEQFYRLDCKNPQAQPRKCKKCRLGLRADAEVRADNIAIEAHRKAGTGNFVAPTDFAAFFNDTRRRRKTRDGQFLDEIDDNRDEKLTRNTWKDKRKAKPAIKSLVEEIDRSAIVNA